MSNLTLQPANGLFIILPELDPEKPQGIIYNQERESSFMRGTVLQVGGTLNNGDQIIEPPAKKGDRVLYNYSGFESIIEDGSEVRLIRFNQIVGVYKNAAK